MEGRHEHDKSDDPFADHPGLCPHCGSDFPTVVAETVIEAVAANAVLVADGKGGAQSNFMFFSRCVNCRTPIWAPGYPTWADSDPTKVGWHRNPNPWATPD